MKYNPISKFRDSFVEFPTFFKVPNKICTTVQEVFFMVSSPSLKVVLSIVMCLFKICLVDLFYGVVEELGHL